MFNSLRTTVLKLNSTRAFSHHLKAFATIDPHSMTGKDKGFNLVKG